MLPSQAPTVTAYEKTLLATEEFLRRVGEQQWANWLREDITAWHKDRDVSHHRQAYGGMGSFNDVVICRMNQHQVTAEQEPWANSLFEWLKAILYYLSAHPTDIPNADTFQKAVGRLAPSLAAFVGGENAPQNMRGFSGAPMKVSGARCLACGYAELTLPNIDSAIADDLVPNLLFEACSTDTLSEAIDRVLTLKLPGLSDMRGRLVSAAGTSSIHISKREEWMRPCPNCGADDSAVYRWAYIAGSPPRFEPTADNIRLRRSAKDSRKPGKDLPERAREMKRRK